MLVDENVAFGLEMRGMAAGAIAARVDEVLRLVRLEGLGARLPRELSGGQQQRVALARALAIRPDVLLLDEPLSNLDAKLRAEVRVEIRELQKALDLTTIMVTHDQEEALTMADRLVVMSEGAVRQIGTQRELYERPADLFVAGFVGRSNILAGVMKSPNIFHTEGGLAIACHSAVTGPARLVLRPERIAIGPAAAGLANRFDAQVEFVSYLGAILELRIRISDRHRFVAQIANRPGIAEPRIGERVPIGWPAEAAFVFAESAADAKEPR
jgi:putative spermidine/putrescine transport system ATP-binding protein